MSGSLNRIELLGRVTRDPELKQTTGGIPYCILGLATSYRKLNDLTKQWEEVPEYHDIQIWNQGNRKLAEVCVNFLRKGSLVYLEGRYRTRSWTDVEGKKRYQTGMAVQDIKLVDPRFGGDSEGQTKPLEAVAGESRASIAEAVASRSAPGEGPTIGGLSQKAIDEASSVDPDEVPW